MGPIWDFSKKPVCWCSDANESSKNFKMSKMFSDTSLKEYVCGEMAQWLSAHCTRVRTRVYNPRAHINAVQCGAHLVIPTFGRQRLVIDPLSKLARQTSFLSVSSGFLWDTCLNEWGRKHLRKSPDTSLKPPYIVYGVYTYTCAHTSKSTNMKHGGKRKNSAFELEIMTLLLLHLQHILAVCMSI